MDIYFGCPFPVPPFLICFGALPQLLFSAERRQLCPQSKCCLRLSRPRHRTSGWCSSEERGPTPGGGLTLCSPLIPSPLLNSPRRDRMLFPLHLETGAQPGPRVVKAELGAQDSGAWWLRASPGPAPPQRSLPGLHPHGGGRLVRLKLNSSLAQQGQQSHSL